APRCRVPRLAAARRAGTAAHESSRHGTRCRGDARQVLQPGGRSEAARRPADRQPGGDEHAGAAVVAVESHRYLWLGRRITGDRVDFAEAQALVIVRRVCPSRITLVYDPEAIGIMEEAMYLFLDTETTGVPRDWNAPAFDLANWPRVVQLGWLQCDRQGKPQKSCQYLIKPVGFKIPADVVRIHGITTERALNEGVDLSVAL